MARQPSSDERSVLPPPGNSPKVERFFLVEIARFLRCSPRDLSALLRKRGHLRRLSPGPLRAPVLWTTARGLQIAIAHFRARQGEKYQRGKDPLAEQDRQRAKKQSRGT